MEEGRKFSRIVNQDVITGVGRYSGRGRMAGKEKRNDLRGRGIEWGGGRTQIIKFGRQLCYLGRGLCLFKNPIPLVCKYIKRTQPANKLIELRTGLKIKLSSHPHDTITAFVILAKQDYGKVPAGSIVVDIGANIGVFSLWAASCMARKVYAYEPNREAYETLRENIRLNHLEDRIIPFRRAVSDCGGRNMKFPVRSSPYNHLIPDETEEDYEWVKTISLDEILAENGIAHVGVLKMDCEGEEYRIFPAASDSVFSRIGEIRMEYHNGPLGSLIPFLNARGYRVSRFMKDNGILWAEKSMPPAPSAQAVQSC